MNISIHCSICDEFIKDVRREYVFGENIGSFMNQKKSNILYPGHNNSYTRVYDIRIDLLISSYSKGGLHISCVCKKCKYYIKKYSYILYSVHTEESYEEINFRIYNEHNFKKIKECVVNIKNMEKSIYSLNSIIEKENCKVQNLQLLLKDKDISIDKLLETTETQKDSIQKLKYEMDTTKTKNSEIRKERNKKVIELNLLIESREMDISVLRNTVKKISRENEIDNKKKNVFIFLLLSIIFFLLLKNYR